MSTVSWRAQLSMSLRNMQDLASDHLAASRDAPAILFAAPLHPQRIRWTTLLKTVDRPRTAHFPKCEELLKRIFSSECLPRPAWLSKQLMQQHCGCPPLTSTRSFGQETSSVKLLARRWWPIPSCLHQPTWFEFLGFILEASAPAVSVG